MVFAVLMLVGTGLAAEEKAREVRSDTGCPIYEADETIPVGIVAHVREKDGSFRGTPTSTCSSCRARSEVVFACRGDSCKAVTTVTTDVSPVAEVKAVNPPTKMGAVRLVHPDTGRPIYDADEAIPVGVVAHVREKDGSFRGPSGRGGGTPLSHCAFGGCSLPTWTTTSTCSNGSCHKVATVVTDK